MPRPSKHISPDTLGGRIRAARENLQLSLAEVASGHYSTSLISQIERNRVDPSRESLRFLAERLHLPFADLQTLAEQHRATDVESDQYKFYEELRIEASQFLSGKESYDALSILEDLHMTHVPAPQRWRIAALRGHAYFELRKFLKAQQDFMYAVSDKPDANNLPMEQQQELLLLHLHLAGTHRELQQFEAAQEQYKTTLQMIKHDTPFGYVAEAHWGMALIAYAQINRLHNDPVLTKQCREQVLRKALEHAENARFLYRSLGEQVRAATVTCQIAHIEQTLGEITKARAHLEEVLSTWSYAKDASEVLSPTMKRRQQDEANVISAAACSLASIELDAGYYDTACHYVNLALDAGNRSYKLRRADAYLMQGRILEAINPHDPAAEKAFRNATSELADTQRIAARVSAHVRLGHHLLKIGKIEESEQELEQARHLSDLVSASGTATSVEDALLS